ETQLTSVWEHAIEPLKEQFAPSIFRAMFQTTEISRLETAELVLVVDNKVIKDFIRKYAEPLVLERICEKTKVVPEKITYTLRPQEKQRRTGRSESHDPRLFSQTKARV